MGGAQGQVEGGGGVTTLPRHDGGSRARRARGTHLLSASLPKEGEGPDRRDPAGSGTARGAARVHMGHTMAIGR